jgi:hypothetical protein
MFVEDRRGEDIDTALATASACRQEASRLRQMRFAEEYQRWLLENARKAERWAAKR